MRTDFLKRLDDLERVIKEKRKTALFITGKNNQVRVDVGTRRGVDLTFSTVYETRSWIEKQIDYHAGGVIDYRVDHICDLFADSRAALESLRSILEKPVIILGYEPRLVNGVVVYQEKSGPESHPQAFSVDRFPAGIQLSKIKPGVPANLLTWCIAGVITRVFDNPAFFERWEKNTLTSEDTLMLLSLLELFARDYPGEAGGFLADFADIFLQETGINMLQGHAEGRRAFFTRESSNSSRKI